MTARILDATEQGVRITVRSGPLDRPAPFRTPSTREDAEAYSAWDARGARARTC